MSKPMKTKLCKRCNSSIPKALEKCPYCKLRQFKPLLLIPYCLIILFWVWIFVFGSTDETVYTDNSISAQVPSSSFSENSKKSEEKKQREVEKAKQKEENEIAKKELEETKRQKAIEKEDAERKQKEEEKKLLKFTAEEIIAIYEDNEIKADKLYKGKRAKITGIVDSISTDILGKVYITLNDGDEYAINSVQCYFKDGDEIDNVAELSKGYEVSVVGTIDGFSIFNVSLEKCEIVK